MVTTQTNKRCWQGKLQPCEARPCRPPPCRRGRSKPARSRHKPGRRSATLLELIAAWGCDSSVGARAQLLATTNIRHIDVYCKGVSQTIIAGADRAPGRSCHRRASRCARATMGPMAPAPGASSARLRPRRSPPLASAPCLAAGRASDRVPDAATRISRGCASAQQLPREYRRQPVDGAWLNPIAGGSLVRLATNFVSSQKIARGC